MKSNFLITVFIVDLLALVGLVYIVLKVPPEGYALYILLFLFWIFVSISSSLVLYRFNSARGHEGERQRFRRQIKKGVLIGILFTGLLLFQARFDII